MREVDHHPPRVQPVDDFATEWGEPKGLRRHGPAAQLIGRVIGELDDLHSLGREHIGAAGVAAHHRGVLEPINQANLVLALRLVDVRDAPHLQQVACMGADQPVPMGDVGQRESIRILLGT